MSPSARPHRPVPQPARSTSGPYGSSLWPALALGAWLGLAWATAALGAAAGDAVAEDPGASRGNGYRLQMLWITASFVALGTAIVGLAFHGHTLRKAEAALRASEEKYRRLFEQMAEPVVVVHARTRRLLAWNEAMQQRYGFAEEELAGLRDIDLVPADELETLSGSPEAPPFADGTVRHVTKTGEARVVDIRSNPITFEGEEARLCILRDTTEQRRMEAVLEESREVLRQENVLSQLLLNGLGEGVAVWEEAPGGDEGRFTLWNSRMAELTGYALEEINRRGWYLTVFPDAESQQRAREQCEAVQQGQKLPGQEWQIVPADGSRRQVVITTHPLPPNGAGRRLLIVMRDVTELSRVRLQLEQREALLAGVFESSLEGIVTVDAEARIRQANGAAARIVGRPPASLPGIRLYEVLPAAVHRVLAAPAAPESLGTLHGRRPDGTTFVAEVALAPVPAREGPLYHLVLRDIAEQHRLESERESLRRVAESWTAPLTLPELGAVLARECRNLFRPDAFFFTLVDSARHRQMTVYAEDRPEGALEPEARREPTAWDDLPPGTVLPERMLADPTRTALPPHTPLTPQGRSLLFAPVIWQGVRMGTLSAQSRQPDSYRPRDLEVFQALADQAAAVVAGIKAAEEVRRLTAELEDRMRRRKSDLERLVHAMAGRELRMAELKKEIERLQKLLQEPPRAGRPATQGVEPAS